MQETRDVSSIPESERSPGEEETATHSGILPGKSCAQRSLTGYGLWECKELDMTWQLSMSMGDEIKLKCVDSQKPKELMIEKRSSYL